MAMNFFEHQEQALRRTGLLVSLYGLAVLGTVALVFGLVVGVLFFTDTRLADDELIGLGFLVPASTLGLILLAAFWKSMQLRGGGRVVAEQMDGRLIMRDTTETAERRLINVVEEMAVAAGIPAPPVYVLDEEGINAFAAGYSADDAVIAVTRGALAQLSRDELQGVVAHEYSHILNADIRLNIRLIGWLHGILFLCVVGRGILRGLSRGRVRSSRNNKDSGGGMLVVIAFAAGLWLVGSVGALFARLIQAAISRQREFLADASAVQFTRNPDGLAGALMKIRANAAGSSIRHEMAQEVSHLFFAGSATRFMSMGFATHPPLDLRIQRLLPHWSPGQNKKELKASVAPPPLPSRSPLPGILALDVSAQAVAKKPALLDETVGHPMEAHLAETRVVLESLPNALFGFLRDPFDAGTVVFWLIMDARPEGRRAQLQLISVRSPRRVSLLMHLEEWHPVNPKVRLPLVDLALPALRMMSTEQFSAFRALFDEVVAVDGQLSLFEWLTGHVLQRHLDGAFRPHEGVYLRIHDWTRAGDAASIILSFLAWEGHSNDHDAEAAFQQAAAHAEFRGRLQLQPLHACTMDAFHTALGVLEQTTFPMRRTLLSAATLAVVTDGNISGTEAELLRLIADALQCPLPVWMRPPVKIADMA